MTTVRLNKELEDQIDAIAQNEHITKSDVIKKALENYCTTFYSEKTPYEIGKELFGRQGSGRKNGSTNYKNIINKIIHEKRNH
ncbi:MAG: ribbon-helix-helix protein, CopG family [Leptospirales bacterium]